MFFAPKRTFCQLIKSNSTVLQTVAVQAKAQQYSTENLTNYFKQNGILIPLEILIEKTKAHDYKFFLDQQNFHLVTDTLEKYQASLDLTNPEASEFILFKKKLYSAYEAKNRSTEEHEALSTTVLLEHLPHIIKANKRHVEGIHSENQLERAKNQATLKGKVYKRNVFTQDRIYGIAGLSIAAYAYTFFPYLAASFGSTLVKSVSFAGLFTGIYSFQEENVIDSIEIIKEGSNKGKVEFWVFKTPFVRRQIICDISDIFKNEISSKNPVQNVLIKSGIDVTAGSSFDTPWGFLLYEEATVDKEGLDWVLSGKEKSEINNLFTDLISQWVRHAGGKVSVVPSLPSLSFGAKVEIEKNMNQLEEMRERYGQDRLEKMGDRELYELFKARVEKS